MGRTWNCGHISSTTWSRGGKESTGGGCRGIAFGIFLTSVLLKKPKSFCFRLLPVLFCPHLDPKTAVFDITYLSYAAEIDFTTCDLCLRNPNAIPLKFTRHCGLFGILYVVGTIDS